MLVGQHPWFSRMGFEGEPNAPGDPGQGQSGSGGGPPASQPAPTGLTQEQVNSIVAQRTAEAKQAAQRELAEALGVSVEEAKKIIEAQRQADDAQKSEAQKAKEQADRAKAEAEQLKAQALAESRKAQATLALAAAGVRADRYEAATAVLLGRLASDASPEDTKSQAEALKKELPEFFGTATPPAPSPSGGPRNGSPATGIEAGRARARAELEAARNAHKNPFEGLPMIGGIR